MLFRSPSSRNGDRHHLGIVIGISSESRSPSSRNGDRHRSEYALGECHRQILIPTRKTPAMIITIVAGYTFLKFLVRKMRDQFRKHEAAGVHPPLCIWAADGSPAALMRCSRRCRSSPGESPTTTRLFFERR